jgi:CelD/BcsL family acetyltransferase involved in cellulose biosynthesis
LNQFDAIDAFSESRPLGFGEVVHFTVGTNPTLTITVHDDIADISQIWLKFQSHAATTLQQTFQWCNAWQHSVGQASGCRPRIVVARDSSGKIIFIVPLQIRRSFGLTILEWHSYPSVNYGYGLFDHEFLPIAAQWFAEEFDRILDALTPFDVLSLRDLPVFLHGHRHPLQAFVNLKAANRAYSMDLAPDFEEFYADKRSLATRKSHRKRDARLETMGQLTFGLPASRDDAHRILDEMFSYQAQRLAQSGVHGVFNRIEREFFHLLIDETNGRDPFLLPYTLKCDGTTLSVMLGGTVSQTFWPFITSISPGCAQKHSPGDYVLRHVIEACCKLGLKKFDFSSGDSSYKQQWADEVIDLRIILKAQNFRGLVWVCAAASRLMVKRFIKQSPMMLSCAVFTRRLLAGRKTCSQQED